MKTIFERFAAVLGVVLVGTILAVTASAECGTLQTNTPKPFLHRQFWQDPTVPESGSLRLVSESGSHDPIVGMWKVVFIAKGNTGPNAPPDGTPIDSAFVQWHGDGTEIMNSGRPPQDGNFCLGVWEKTGRARYKLNHFALGNDNANAPSGIGNPAGPTNIREDIVLSRDRNSYAGTFILDAFDPAGNNVVHIMGEIIGTRVTVDTPVGSIL
jgi:hypothetical protein